MEKSLKDYIEENVPGLKDRLFAGFTTDLSDVSVAYTISPMSGGHVKQSQLELKIIHADYDVCKNFEEKIMKLMDMEEDALFVVFEEIRFRSSIAGGGVLFNEGCQMYEDTLYFMIDWRKTNGNR